MTRDDDQGRHAFGYDDQYQLTSVTHPLGPAETFSYDAANQLLGDAEFTYFFDADGNCTSKVSKLDGRRHEFVFNSENRMTGYRKYDISSALLATADYYYDAVGRRMAKSVDGVLTRYIYHQEDICAELGADGQVCRSYAHGIGIDEALATWGSDARVYYYLTDALGTVRHIRDDNPSAFNLVATFNYDSFGQLLPSSSTGWNDAYRYTARQWDPESATYHYRARQYDPHGGRFVSADPIGVQGLLYPYAGNDPVDFVDPFGLQHSAGGPWHPENGVKTACTPADDCLVILDKIRRLSYMIEDHRRWVGQHPGKNDHARDIADLIVQILDCKRLYAEKCSKLSPPRICPKPECEKKTILTAVMVGAYIVYKLVELWLCPPLVPVTP